MQQEEINAYADILRGSFLFSRWDADTLRLLERTGEVLRFSRGDTVLPEGAPRLGIMLSGRAAVRSTAGGGAVLNVLERGDVFGAAAVFLGGGISRVEAQTACAAALFSAQELSLLLEGDPRVAREYIVFLSRKIAFLNREIAGFTGGEALHRVARYIFAAPPEALRAVNCSALAKRLDIGRASLYRALDALSADGAIQRDGKAVAVIDREKLSESCK